MKRVYYMVGKDDQMPIRCNTLKQVADLVREDHTLRTKVCYEEVKERPEIIEARKEHARKVLERKKAGLI